MTQDCSHPSSTADVNPCQSKSLPKGINIIEADENSAPRVEVVSKSEEEAPWGYIFIRHYLVKSFEKKLKTLRVEGKHVPNSFIHCTTDYKRKPNGKGVMKTEKPTISGLVFLQGETEQLTSFLEDYFPSYHLVNNCSTKVPASIKHSIMKPFMRVMETEPERVTFLRDPFLKFAKDHVKLRVLTGPFQGQEGYIIRILRDRHLVMDLGGYAVAISHVHNEDFEVAE